MSDEAPGAAMAPESGAETAPPPTYPGAMPEGQPPSTLPERDAPETSDESEDPREAGLSEEVQRLITTLRKENRENAKARKSAEARLREIADAGRSELERVTEERDTLRAENARIARESLTAQIAAEAGIPQLAHRLRGDDVRALRADAQKMREELGITSPGMDGGVRSVGVPTQPVSMDDFIRGGTRR